MITAVNRELRSLPSVAAESAVAELARVLAREIDAGDMASASRLVRVLAELRKLAAPPKGAPVEAPQVEEPDELDELARARADRLADAAGVVRSLGANKRRAGGRSAG